MKKNRLIIILAAVILVTGLAAGTVGYCLGSSGAPAAEETVKDFSVDLEYGSISYPEKWEKELKVTQEQKEDCLAVKFEAELKGKLYPLFTLNIGGGDGMEAGAITDESGTQRTVYLVLEDAEYPELSEEEQRKLYTMQEEVNYILDNLE